MSKFKLPHNVPPGDINNLPISEILGIPKSMVDQAKSYPITKAAKMLKAPKVKISSFGIFMHEDLGLTDMLDHLNHAMRVIEIAIHNNYMCRMPTFNLTDREMEDSSDIYDWPMEDVIIKCKRVMKEVTEGTHLNFRVESPSYTVYICIHWGIEYQGSQMVQLTPIIYNKKDQVLRSSLYFVNMGDETLGDMSMGAFVLSPNRQEAEATIIDSVAISNASNFRHQYHVDMFTLGILAKCLRMFARKAIKVEEKDNKCPPHSEIEMYAIKKILTDVDKAHVITANVRCWCNPDANDRGAFDLLSRKGMPAFIGDDQTDVPLVDFTVKERNYLRNYMQQHGYFGAKEGVTINLETYLMEPRYGPDLRWTYIDPDNMRPYLLTTSFDLLPGHDYLRVYLIHRLTPVISVYALVDFTGIHHFTGAAQIANISIDMLQHDPDNLISDWEEFKGTVPSIFMNVQDLVYIALEVLKLHVIIHDRPQRTRMLKCTRAVPRRKIGQGGKEIEEKDFVVTRILKPLREAKALVAQSESEGGSMRSAQYVIESWDRVGHYRRIPGTDRKIWIDATKCHRHLPLTEKEIHIKL